MLILGLGPERSMATHLLTKNPEGEFFISSLRPPYQNRYPCIFFATSVAFL